MRILFLGDFLYDYDSMNDDIANISEFIKKQNLSVILNLEAPLKSSKRLNKMINLYNSEYVFQILKELNVVAVNLANNHIMDWEEEGLRKLINELKKNKIGYFGAGFNLKDANKPYILSTGDKSISFYGFGWRAEESIYAKFIKPGVAPLKYPKIKKILNNDHSDIIIPSFHWGYEYEKLPQPLDRYYANKIIMNDKVKIILGHHPHIIQAKEKNIYYSLGNFYFGSLRANQLKQTNSYIKNETSYGLGVIFDTETYKTEEVYFKHDGEHTSVIKSIPDEILPDITNVPLKEYKKYFRKNAPYKANRNYVQHPGFINEAFINDIKILIRDTNKFYLRKIKWPLGRLYRKLIKRR